MTKVCSLHTWLKEMKSKKDCEKTDEQEKWGEDKGNACKGPREGPTAAGPE